MERRIFIFSLIGGLLLLLFACKGPDYKNPELPFAERAADLVRRMTLEEKVGQMIHYSDEIRRLNIPAYNWWNEGLHGVARAGEATVFPQAIGMAAMWDKTLMEEIATIISDEARAKYARFCENDRRGIYHGLTFWSPNINLFRDPRWGRGMETYGEDPFLSGELGIRFIRGLQGYDPKYLKVLATAKHFAVHSGPESTRHSANVSPSLIDLYDSYLPHFERAVVEAKVESVMCAYQRLNGQPCCGNPFLSGLLRNEWGFDGYIVSDCWAISDFYQPQFHHVVEKPVQAAALALNAGTDLNCGPTFSYLKEAVERGLVSEASIDTALTRLMTARMHLGMFDKETPFDSIPYECVASESHKALSHKVAEESMVLLENDGTLPLSKQLKKIAVIGPNADATDVLYANYHGFSRTPITLLDGIKKKLPECEVVYAPGSRLADEMPLLTPIPAASLYVDSACTTHGLKGEYYRLNKSKTRFIRIDTIIDFNWWENGPSRSLDPTAFEVQWSGYLNVPVSGKYAIALEAQPKAAFSFNREQITQFNNEHEPGRAFRYFLLEAGVPYHISIHFTQVDSDNPCVQLLYDLQEELLTEGIETAKEAEAVVLALGLSPHLEGEDMRVDVPGFQSGDRTALRLPDSQQALLKAVLDLGKPTVVVLMNGSAVTLEETPPALLEAWYPGEQGGAAIADVLFGDYNPGGRLPVTFYKTIEDIPTFDLYSMAGRTYRYFEGEPLYPFGYGLSYTTFSYRNPQVISGDDHSFTAVTVSKTAPLLISAEVSNTGHYDGDEVVQLYLQNDEASHPEPRRKLIAFERIHIPKGESRLVHFIVSPTELLPHSPATYEAMAGANQPLERPKYHQLFLGGGQPGTGAPGISFHITAKE